MKEHREPRLINGKLLMVLICKPGRVRKSLSIQRPITKRRGHISATAMQLNNMAWAKKYAE